MHHRKKGVDASAGLVTISAGHAIRKGQLVVISDGTVTTKGYVSAVPSSTTLNILPYSGASLDLAPSSYSDADPVKLFVFGSEFAKGKSGMERDTTVSYTHLTLPTICSV